jgi:hypothetical protein
MRNYIFLCFLALIGLACSESNNQSPFEERNMTKAEIQEFKAEVDALFIKSGFKNYMYSQLDHSDMPTFTKIDEQYKDFIKANKGHKYLYTFRKQAAAFIIKEYDLTKSGLAKDFDNLGFYTKEVGNGSFEDHAVLMIDCLEKLNGHWSKVDMEFYLDLSKKELGKRQKSVGNYIKQSEDFVGDKKNEKSVLFEPSKEMLKGLKEEKVALILQTQKLQSLIPLDPIL